ncbi:ATP-dependent DNA helicase PcrA [Patescibacteria group bacterium]|nr:MAG: ATP-dependent DNA helicase PcrA [Patescibacteria group bacterium]
MKDLLSELNEPQRQAVLATEGPVLMLAGAGSGKTKALTHRVAYLVREKKVSPSNILAVTFTNKAAGEMRHRVLALLGRPVENKGYLPFMGTFHAICLRILRRDGAHIGLSSSFTIFDAQDSLSSIKQAMRQLGIDEKQYAPNYIAALISSAKNELLTAAAYGQYARGGAQQVAAQVYPLYQQILTQAGAVDFDDIIMKTVQLFKHPDILEHWQRQFSYIMIDEYQDTNHAQYRLVKLLATAHRNICVVGDDWQAIYSWRGANFQNILDFEKDYPDAQVIKLEQNYRSTKNILDAAHAVIAHNTVRSNKKLWTDRDGGEGVNIITAFDQDQEGDIICQTVERLVATKQIQLRDVAILYRVGAQSRTLEEALLRHNLPYKIVGGTRFYERKEIKDAMAYLRLIHNPEDIVSFNRVINLPPRGLGDKSLERLMQFRRSRNVTLLEALAASAEVEGLTAKARAALLQFYGLIHSLRLEADRLPVASLLERVLHQSGYMAHLDDGSVTAGDRIENVKELLSVAETYQELGLDGFLEEVALVSDIDNYSTDTEAVTLMTMHAAKGLEFPLVFIPGMEEGIFPHSRTFTEASELEEERRLCYVAMTRAKHQLYLLHTQSRLLYGGVQYNPPSRFLQDIPLEVQTTQYRGMGSPQPATEVSHMAEDKADLQPGDKVRHAKFGQGIVTAVEGDEVTAAFEGLGTKRLSLSFAPLEKLEN